MSNDLISILVPVYNVEQYLNRCIDSIINQTYKNLEIILVDDGSTDNSGKICDEYALKDNRIKVIHKENGGVSSARNVGLDIAKGKYIGFVDSDDYIEPDMYEILYNLLIKNKVDISCCNYFILDKTQNILINKDSFNKILSFNDILEQKTGIYVWNKLYNRQLIGNIRVNEEFSLGEDLDFNFRVLKRAKKISFCKDAKYFYCDNPNSIVRKRIFKEIYLKHIFLYDEIIQYCRKNNLKEAIKNNKRKQINWIVAFLSLIAREKPIRNKESLEILLRYARKNLWHCIFGKSKFFKKSFMLLCCINFNLASSFYRLMFKLKVIK